MTALIPLPYRILAVLLLIAACIGFGWVKGCEHTNQAWELKQARAEQAAELDAQRKTAAFNAADIAHTKALQEKQDEIDRLSAAVADGTVRLRIAAHCPVQAAATGAGMDPGSGPELDASARPAYFALRSGLARQAEQLKGCQDLLQLERAP